MLGVLKAMLGIFMVLVSNMCFGYVEHAVNYGMLVPPTELDEKTFRPPG